MWIAKDEKFLDTDNQDSDQTPRICRADLSLQFAGRTLLVTLILDGEYGITFPAWERYRPRRDKIECFSIKKKTAFLCLIFVEKNSEEHST